MMNANQATPMTFDLAAIQARLQDTFSRWAACESRKAGWDAGDYQQEMWVLVAGVVRKNPRRAVRLLAQKDAYIAYWASSRVQRGVRKEHHRARLIEEGGCAMREDETRYRSRWWGAMGEREAPMAPLELVESLEWEDLHQLMVLWANGRVDVDWEDVSLMLDTLPAEKRQIALALLAGCTERELKADGVSARQVANTKGMLKAAIPAGVG